MEITRYKNIDAGWGENVYVYADDYRRQAKQFELDVTVTEDKDGIYVDGKKVAESV